MLCNFKRLSTFVLLTSAASTVLAAPAPVSDLNSRSVYSSSGSTGSETNVQRLERLLRNQNQVQLQLQQQLDDLSSDLQELRGQIERNSHDISQITDRQRELFVELDNLRQQKEPAKEPQSTAEDSVDTSHYVASAAEQKAYQDAIDLILKKRDISGAIGALNQFRKDYPKSTFTPNAYYWLGQLYYAKMDDKNAISSFKSVLVFNSSNKRADALVKLGELETRNNHSDKAKAYYEQVIKEYPGSASARTAQEKLAK
ncbi:tol-pal system protein YbgF [Vibrio salinus]|uniref:tol-pal system protein YbgF n=1 Tax=Vibrio salinus TaxID=2899784 RepID=UPI001E35A9A7|nr:tol-pal system protein YbgF [Vibrio salinus]MCE0492811.1 tol-pal system protein YbgF [Vibrio salinus]